MNQRGIWQLILMAREGDRNAIDELFYASFRPVYLIVLTLTGDRQQTLDILEESYIHIFQNLDEVEQADMFAFDLNRYAIRLALEKTGRSADALTLSAEKESLAEDFLQDPPCLHDFNTLRSVDLSATADNVLSQFQSLSEQVQLCSYLYYFAEVLPEQIADVMACTPQVVFGTLQYVRRTVLPSIGEVIRAQEALKGVDAESSLLWALRNTARYTLLTARLESFYQGLVGKMVDAEILDTALTEDTSLSDADIPIRDMKPIQENTILKQIFSLRTLVIGLVLLTALLGAYGLRQLRAYHHRRNQWNDFTDRTTLSMTQTPTQREYYIFSTELEAPTEPETTMTTTTEPETEAPTEPETTTTTAPTERTDPVITTARPGSDFAFSENGNQLTITGYNGSRATVEIPAQIDGKTVVAIGDNAFFNTSLTSIKMPNTLKTIGKNAFHSCTGLTAVTLPSGITAIESNAFRGCTNLRTVTLPNTLKKMGEQAFYRCTTLTGVTLPDTLQTIGDWAFAYCTNLGSIAIPESVTGMGSSVFYECKSLTRCTFSSKSKLAALGDSTFFDCTSLAGVAFPATVKAVPANCFVGCRSMSTVTFGANMTTIGANAFKDCISLSSPKLPAKLTRIEAGAFQGCTSIQSVTFPSGLLSIGDSAYRDCINLRSANIPASVKTIGNDAFLGCDGGLVFTCPEGSAAEKYALANDIEIYGRKPDVAEDDDSGND